MANIRIALSDATLTVKGDVQVILRDILGRVFHLSFKELDARYTKDWRSIIKVYPSLESYPKITVIIEVSSLQNYDVLRADVTATFKKHWERVLKDTCDMMQ